jgi:DNA-directed RNA polymerase specialized sigma24 family protein
MDPSRKGKGPMTETTDLLQAASNGDELAEAEAFQRLEPELRGMARCRLREFGRTHPDRPRLTTIELVLRAYEKTVRQTVRGQPAEWQHKGHFFKFVAKKMGWLLQDELGRPLVVSIEQIGEPAAGEKDVADLVAAREELGRLDAALAKLAPELRETIQLYFYVGMKGPAIAEVCQVAPATVYARLKVAQDKLREELQDPGLELVSSP